MLVIMCIFLTLYKCLQCSTMFIIHYSVVQYIIIICISIVLCVIFYIILPIVITQMKCTEYNNKYLFTHVTKCIEH